MADFDGRGLRTTAGRGLGCSGCASLVLAPVMGCGITGFVFAMIELSKGESDAAAIAAFARCPVVTEALGTPLEEAFTPLSCGESETGGGSGEAEWSIRVRGPRGTGSGWYAAVYSGGGPWVVSSATIVLPDGRSVTAVPCQGGGADPGRDRDDRDRERERERDDRGDRDRDDRGDRDGKGGKGRR